MDIEGIASLSIKSREMGVTIKVIRNSLLLQTVKGDIYGALRFLLYCLVDIIAICPLF